MVKSILTIDSNEIYQALTSVLFYADSKKLIFTLN